MARATLEDLRRVFREEFDDLLRLLSEVESRARAATTGDEAKACADELRRILHTLKGAARSAGIAPVEAEAHRLESMPELARGTASDTNAASIADVARRSLDAMGRLSPVVHGESAASSRRDPAKDATDVAASPPASADTASDAGGASTLSRETMRVDGAALASVLDASENLVLEMMRGGGLRGSRALDETAGELAREIELIKRLAVAAAAPTTAGNELRRRIDRAASITRTLATSLEMRESQDARAWSTASARASTLAAAARTLRHERFDVLAVPAAQAAREIAKERGLEVEVRQRGDVRFDRRLRDELREILLHLVRNAVAHGLETPHEREAAGKPRVGTIEIRAEELDGELRITVIDDGRGIDRALVERRAKELGLEGDPLEAIFAPGLSTSAEVSELAGRGIGLDVVRQRVAALHGRISVSSQPGAGTTFRVSVAPDLTLTRALLVRAGEFVAALRLSAVDRIVNIAPSEISEVGGRLHLLSEGTLLPLASLPAELAAASRPLEHDANVVAVIVGIGERRVALAVDEVFDEREIAVRPLRGRMRSVRFVSGTTLLADGRLAWVVDMRSLAAVARGAIGAESVTRVAAKRVLVVDDSATTRELERTLLRAAGFEVETAADGERAWALLQGDRAFDVVLSDLEMPNLDGFGLLARIRASQRHGRLPVVLVTALEDASDKQRALDLGASAYIVKSSFDEEHLLDVIAHLT